MSGPNTDYDPVEVTPLKADQVEAMREAALAAIAAAADLEALKQVRLDHAGDRSPIALANREIGALPPQARKEAGQRVGQARGAINQAVAARQAVLEAEHEERMLAEETVDVSLPTTRRRRGSRVRRRAAAARDRCSLQNRLPHGRTVQRPVHAVMVPPGAPEQGDIIQQPGRQCVIAAVFRAYHVAKQLPGRVLRPCRSGSGVPVLFQRQGDGGPRVGPPS